VKARKTPTRHMVDDTKPPLGQSSFDLVGGQSSRFGRIHQAPSGWGAAEGEEVVPVVAALVAVVDVVAQGDQPRSSTCQKSGMTFPGSTSTTSRKTRSWVRRRRRGF
jgi:hypothetical protein